MPIIPHHSAHIQHARPVTARTLTLYDGARNTAPDAQNWLFYTTGGGQAPPHGTGMTTFSTGSDAAYQGGYLRIVPFPLDRARGYTLTFDLQVLSESHAGPDRAGVDLIALGNDKKGIELGFWTDHIWAQSDVPLFTHAEGAPYPTTKALVHYALTFYGSSYALRANGAVVLSGKVRDYTAFHGFPNPYVDANVIFLGDDSKSAAGGFRLARFTVSRGVAGDQHRRSASPVANHRVPRACQKTAPATSPLTPCSGTVTARPGAAVTGKLASSRP